MTKNAPLSDVATVIETVTNQAVEALTKKFWSIGKRNAEGTIKLGQLFAEAHDTLGEKLLDEFYRSTKVKAATGRKLRKIGEMSARFDKCLEVLPNAWTSLYGLATLDPHTFTRVLDSGALHPCVTWQEIQ